MKSHYHSELLETAPPNFLFFPYKNKPLTCFSDLFIMILHGVLVPNCDSSAIPELLHFAGKITDSFVF